MLLLLPEGIRSSELGYTLLFLLDMSSFFLSFLVHGRRIILITFLNIIEREKKRNHDEIKKETKLKVDTNITKRFLVH